MEARYRLIGLAIIVILLTHVPGNSSKGQDLHKDSLILLKVSGPNNTWAKAWLVEGQMIKVYNEKTGLHFAFSPAGSLPARREVRVKVYAIATASYGEKLNEIEIVTVPLGASKAIISKCSIGIEAEAIKLPASDISLLKASAKLTPSIAMSEGGASCCIVCDGRKYCANCAIITSCGCCNTEACAGECR